MKVRNSLKSLRARHRGEPGSGGLALAGLEAPVRLIDDVDPPFTPHDAIVAVAAPKRFQ